MHPATTERGESLSTPSWGRPMSVIVQIKAFALSPNRSESAFVNIIYHINIIMHWNHSLNPFALLTLVYSNVCLQVSHHPPISACHAESKNFIFWQGSGMWKFSFMYLDTRTMIRKVKTSKNLNVYDHDFSAIASVDVRWKNKFWGKSMEIVPIGTTHVTLPEWVSSASFTLEMGRTHTNHLTRLCHMDKGIALLCHCRFGDHYEWNKVTSCIHNILTGQRWIEHYGEISIKNSNSDICQCKITFVKVRQNATTLKTSLFSPTVHPLCLSFQPSIPIV